MEFDKRSRTFNTLIGKSHVSRDDLGARLFIESLGNHGTEFLQSFELGREKLNDNINKMIMEVEIGMKTATKGSVFQYLYFFPDDAFLNLWADLISQVNDKVTRSTS